MGGYVYVMANVSLTTLYIGVTNDLVRRVFEHVQEPAEGSFVKRYSITRLIYAEYHASIVEAIAREKQLKRWSRNKKAALITASNPTWRDLSTWPEAGGLPDIEMPEHWYGQLNIEED